MKTKLWFNSLIFFFILASCGDKLNKTVVEKNSKEEQLLESQKKVIAQFTSQFLTQNRYPDSTTINSVVATMYSNEECLWSNGQILNKSAISFIQLIKRANFYGLDTNFYPTEELTRLADSLTKDTGNEVLLSTCEWELSKTCLEFYSHVKSGFLNHDSKDSLYYQTKIDSLTTQDIGFIVNAIKNNKLTEVIDTLEPSFFEFKELRKSWGEFLKDKTISQKRVRVESLKEDSTKAYERAKEALLLYGYLDTTQIKTNQGLVEVLKRFQSEHGLSSDGRIGRATARALSRSNYDRWLAAMTSIEKMKWNPIKDDTLFYANIPAYSLKVVENNAIAREYRTVVGKTINRTPEFSSEMKYLILNPFWHLPRSISSKEILPKLKVDAGLAKKKGYRIYDKDRNVVDASKVDWSKVSQSSFNYKISQVRSGYTALGKVKFIFTNKYSIYFHDTPSKRLFKNDIRAYSHGCVRVQNPLDLAQYILSRQDSLMTMDSVTNFTKRGIQKRFDLTYKMNVYIRYYSCEGTPEGNMIFFRDIYKKETPVREKIEEIMAENQHRKNG